MSESDPDPLPPSLTARRRWIRNAILATIGCAVAAVIVLLAVYQRPSRPRLPIVAAGDAGAMALRAPQQPQLPDHGERLAGIVVDGAGAPVEGASLSAELDEPIGAGAPPAGDAGANEAFANDAGASDAGANDAGVVATPVPTDASGRFVLGGLTPGRHRIRVTGSGLLDAELRMVAVPADELRIVVARQVTLEGTVTDGGVPVAGATVGVRGDAIGGTIEVPTTSGGGFTVTNLPEGRYQVYAHQGSLAARSVRVVRLGAGPFPPVELRLEAGAVVVGRVIDREEGTGAVAAIELRPIGDDEAPRYARSGDDGVLRIAGVPNGRWIADAYAPGYLSPGGVELEAGRGVPELALTRGGTIEGRVLDGDGRPIAGASVRALAAGANAVEVSALVELERLRRFSGRTAATIRAGPSTFAGDPSFVERGELGVLVGPIPPIPPPGAAPARPAAVIDPKLVGMTLAGEPEPLAVEPSRASIWTTGSDGRYRIRGLARGKLSAVASAPAYAEARSREVAVVPGQLVTGVDIVLGAGTFVFGRVADPRGAPIAGAQVSARPEVGHVLDAFSDGDGMYRLGPLAGTLTLSARAYGHVEVARTIELAAGKGSTPNERREDLTLEAADAVLAGTLDDATGAAVGGAQLEVVAGAGQGRSVVVAPDGTFSLDMLPRGRLRVRVSHPAYPTEELEAVASSTGERVRLRLPLGGQVEGVLIDASSGAPLAGMTIDARGVRGATAEAVTDDKGLWKLGPVRPGSWRLSVKLPGYLPTARELDVPVSRAPGATSVRDIHLELERGALLGGTVRDRRGQRVAGAQVSVRRADGTGTTVEANTDGHGEFRIHDCPTGELVIAADKAEAAGSTRASVRPGDEILGLSLEIR
jgi:hypothetical protein